MYQVQFLNLYQVYALVLENNLVHILLANNQVDPVPVFWKNDQTNLFMNCYHNWRAKGPGSDGKNQRVV